MTSLRRNVFVIFLSCMASPAYTEELRTPTALWVTDASGQAQLLSIRLQQHLTERQRKLIDSGFTTYSELEVRSIELANKSTLKIPEFKLRCTVKFDAWEEHYDVARIEKNVDTTLVKSFSDYSERCLTLSVKATSLDKTIKQGATIIISMQVNQMSPEKSQAIKGWLVRQQTGVMQGLFSHMLGDLNLSERTLVKVNVPASMSTAEAEQ